MASVQSLQSLPQDLTSSGYFFFSIFLQSVLVESLTSSMLIKTRFHLAGRFDFHIELSALAVPERKALLQHQVEEHDLLCSEEVLSEIASKCEGYDAYDLVILTLSYAGRYDQLNHIFVKIIMDQLFQQEKTRKNMFLR
jgi:peroxin-1